MSKVLTFGDLSIDVVVHFDRPPGSVPFQGADVTVVGVPRLQLGGTALLFAQALEGHGSPHVIGCVGEDAAGHSIETLLKDTGIEHDLHVTHNRPTAVINVVYDTNGERLMVRSNDNANKQLPADVAISFVGNVSEYSGLFVSGYLLTLPTAPVIATLLEVATDARAAGVPIILDCVPHEFLEHVGTLDDVTGLIGPVDAVVMELRTAAELGYVAPGGTITEALQEAAEKIGEEVATAVVQARTADHIYSQAMRHDGSTVVLHYPCNPRNMLGLGDHLLVDALTRVRMLQ